MAKRIFAAFALSSAAMAALPAGYAIATDVETLPAGVRLTQARVGYVSGLNQTWDSDSKLYDLGETRSVGFDAATLSRVNPHAKALIQALDHFGTKSLGSKINLGTLDVSTKPELSYVAPVFAYGLTSEWTVGVGIPLVRYRNRIALSSTDSNLDFYRSQFSGISKELDAALDIDLVAEAKKVLAEKGYKPVSDRDQGFIGDVEVAVLHRLPSVGAWRLLHQTTLHLPTGPKDDPDDLAALNSFGRLSVDNTLIAAREIARQWTLLPTASLALPVPDRVTKRVPKDEDDVLPDASAKHDVLRATGVSASLGAEIAWQCTSRWRLKTSTEATLKAADRYEGPGRVELLARDTDSFVQRVGAGVTYSTAEDFQTGASLVPGRLSLDVSDTVAGRNIERQLRTELSAVLFF